MAGVPPQRYTAAIPTSRPRIQITVDDELAAVLDAIDPRPASRAGLVRDLAVRGADALHEERVRTADAVTTLLEIADGAHDLDLGAAADLAAARGDRLA